MFDKIPDLMVRKESDQTIQALFSGTVDVLCLKYFRLCYIEIPTKQQKAVETKDLYQDGYNLAVQGVPESLFASYQIKCDKYGVKLNQAQYEKGRTAGLKVFCSFETGYQVGRAGKPYHNVCPKNLELDFLRGYSAGLKQNVDFNQIMKTIYKNQSMYQWMLLNEEN